MSVFRLIGQDPDMVAGLNMQQEISGEVFDAGPGGYSADIVGDPRAGVDNFGNFLNFDGSLDYLEQSSIPALKSIVFWMTPLSDTGNILVIGGGAESIEVTSGTLTATGFVTPKIYVDADESTSITVGKRHMIVVTSDTSTTAGDLIPGLLEAKLYSLALYNVAKTEAWIKQEYKRAKIYF